MGTSVPQSHIPDFVQILRWHVGDVQLEYPVGVFVRANDET